MGEGVVSLRGVETVKNSPYCAKGLLAALNAITHEIISISNTTYISADSVCELLRRIAAQSITGAITLVLDNARASVM